MAFIAIKGFVKEEFAHSSNWESQVTAAVDFSERCFGVLPLSWQPHQVEVFVQSDFGVDYRRWGA